MQQEELQLTTGDSQTLAASAFHPDKPAKGVIVIASALGVPRKIHGKFAAWLAENNFAALTFDYRGIGDSKLNGLKGHDVQFSDWGAQDIEAAYQWALSRYPDTPLIHVGNSCGGQLFGLAPSSTSLKAAILVAGQSAYWGHWPMPGRIQMGIMFNAVIPLLSMGKTFPARRLGMSSVNAPSGITRQWARWGRLPRYLFDKKSGLDTRRYTELNIPILAYGFDDDDFAPAASINALCREFTAASIERRQVNPKEHNGSIGHFGFFKEKHCEGLWQPTLDWLQAQV